MPKESLTAETIAGRYQLISRISSGGMGEVHRARDNVLGRTVAVKILPSHLASDAGFVERFRTEAQSAARLSHPNVVQVHDWGEWEDTYYMVMEYVRGKNLRQILSGRDRLEPAQACEVIDQVLSGLEAAHREGFVHRDIKPENVLISNQGTVKVTDFGIARAAEGSSGTAGLFGTVAYVAPEQVRSDKIDPRTDIYSTGCLLYELLTGSTPFTGDAARVLHQHLNESLTRPSVEAPEVSEALDKVVLKATEKDPDMRYATADAMRSDVVTVKGSLPSASLTELTSELTSEVAPESQPTIAGVPQKRKKVWPKLLIALALLLVIVVAWMNRPMEVPEIVGVDEEKAIALLTESGFDNDVRYERNNASRPDAVLRSDPKPGERARRGSTVVLIVSRGPEVATLEDLKGLTLEAAKRELKDSGLQAGEVTEAHSNEAPGTVLEQTPAPGKVNAGTPVNLVVSKGPEIVDVPDVVGKTWEEAQAILEGRGLQASKIEEFNDAVAGQVVAQSPAKDSKANKGSSVTVTVSKGPEPFQMPDVRSKSCSDAKSQLESLGLVVVVRSPDNKGTCGSNKVSEQDPFPGATVRKGQEANLYVS